MSHATLIHELLIKRIPSGAHRANWVTLILEIKRFAKASNMHIHRAGFYIHI